MNEFEMSVKNLRIFYRCLPEAQLLDLHDRGGFLIWWRAEMSYLLCFGKVTPPHSFLFADSNLNDESNPTAQIFDEDQDPKINVLKWRNLKQFRSWLLRNADLHHRRLEFKNV